MCNAGACQAETWPHGRIACLLRHPQARMQVQMQHGLTHQYEQLTTAGAGRRCLQGLPQPQRLPALQLAAAPSLRTAAAWALPAVGMRKLSALAVCKHGCQAQCGVFLPHMNPQCQVLSPAGCRTAFCMPAAPHPAGAVSPVGLPQQDCPSTFLTYSALTASLTCKPLDCALYACRGTSSSRCDPCGSRP